MENYQMGRSSGRPYRTTCGMNRMPSNERMTHRSCQKATECSCRMPGTISHEEEMYSHLKSLPPAMAYVPCQTFSKTFDLKHALHVGTIFPELCRPFCGKRGVRK